MEQNVTYVFGPFRLQTDTQLLRYEGTTTSLQPKIYSLLLYFLQHSGRLISREELFAAVWQGRIVEDTALRLSVNALRKALHDESKNPHYILTACKCGYRFLPEVKVETGYQRNAAPAKASDLHYQARAGLPDAAQEHDTELSQLLEAFAQVTDGKRNLVFLNGEQGAGKTALLDRFLATIRQPEFGVLRARCVQLNGAAEPYLPLLEALERHCQEPHGKPLIEHLHQVAPTWLYQMLNVLEPDKIATLLPKVSQITTGRMLREGADFFETLATKSTIILILDNSHWSDTYTLDLLMFLVCRCSPARLLIIMSYRPNETGDSALRLEKMREELRHRSLYLNLSLHKARLADKERDC